jgi:hypothetical protein
MHACDAIGSLGADMKNACAGFIIFKAGLGGFEPPTSGLEARRYVQAKPQAHMNAY